MSHPEGVADADYLRAVTALVAVVGARGIPLTSYDLRTKSEYTYWEYILGGMPAPQPLGEDESNAIAGKCSVGRYLEVYGRFRRNYVGLDVSMLGEVLDCSSAPHSYVGRMALGGLLYVGSRDPLSFTECIPDAILDINGFIGRYATTARASLRFADGKVELTALSDILDAFRLTEIIDEHDGMPFQTEVALGPPQLRAIASFMRNGQPIHGFGECGLPGV